MVSDMEEVIGENRNAEDDQVCMSFERGGFHLRLTT